MQHDAQTKKLLKSGLLAYDKKTKSYYPTTAGQNYIKKWIEIPGSSLPDIEKIIKKKNPCKLPPVKNPKVSKLGRPIQPPTYRMRASANKRFKPAPRRKGHPREEGHKPPRAIFIKDTERGSIIGTQLTITYHRQGEYYRHVFNKNVMLIHPEGKHYLIIYDNAGRMTFKKQSGIHG